MSEDKDFNVAKLMANRTGMIINDIQISKLLENSMKSKERYKLILESRTFDPIVQVAASSEPVEATDSKKWMTALNNLRMKKSELKAALMKKYRRTITDRILTLLEN